MLEFVGDADEFRSSPASLPLQMVQPAVIEACTAAKSCAATVDCDQRHEDQVEGPHREMWRIAHIGFGDAERIASQRCVRVAAYELHAVPTSLGDHRQVDVAAAMVCQCNDVGKIRLTSLTQVERDVTARTQQAQASHHSCQADRSG